MANEEQAAAIAQERNLRLQAPGGRDVWFRQMQARAGLLLRGKQTAQSLRPQAPAPEE